ncbi:hypothetical protein [Limnoglobus roseus]|uniref:Uncharacterized protein n=1 Tax=Limnoglobus roseus TaxID=2598579 RepID=A0A5C1AGA5_9BACT|nr:hypothetical protein [Limnoglobus roseus]QEL17665.1 hypothetical protein PX52LOC_04663 [Limnoglobus roseus]
MCRRFRLPEDVLKPLMTEAEFRAHLAGVNRLDDPEDRLVHLATVAATILNLIASSSLVCGKPPFDADDITPWAKKGRRAAPAGEQEKSDEEYAAAVQQRLAQHANARVRE